MIQKSFIRSELHYRYPELIDSIRNPMQSVGRPLLFEQGSRSFGARIIVCLAEELNNMTNKEQPDTLFLSIGTPSDNVLQRFDVCILPPEEQTGVVLNFIQRLFDRLDEWTTRLKQAAETGGGVEELLALAADMLQNPILLLDERKHIVAQSGSMELDSHEIKVHLNRLSPSDLEPNRVIRLESSDETQALVLIIPSGNTQFVLFCAGMERPLYGSDEIVFESLSGFLRLMLSERSFGLHKTRTQRDNDKIEPLLRSMLSQNEPDAVSIRSLSELGWFVTDYYTIITAEPINGDLRAAQANTICEKLEAAIPGSCAFVSLPFITAIVRTSEATDIALRSQLLNIAEEENLHFGVCEAYPGFQWMAHRLELAKRALNRAGVSKRVALSSEQIDSYLTGQATAEFPPELLCMRSVLAMAQYDQEHETYYVSTTEQYIKNRFNAVQTANDLFIHRSTLLYRLDRIKSQFGLDLEDKQISLLHLMLSLRLIAQVKQ